MEDGNSIAVRVESTGETEVADANEVAVISKKIVKNGKYYWAKVTVGVSQSMNVEGWVCSKYCEGCWN